MIKKLTLTILASTVLASAAACAPKDLRDDKGVVRPSNSSWIEEQFLTEIVNIGLERLDYEVEDIQQADYAALHVSMANGALDYTTGFYEPAHQSFFENAGGDEKLERIGHVVLGGGVHGLLIDKKTADEHNISRLEQLQDSDIAQLFDTDGDGKANLAGCDVGWKCNEIIEHQIDVVGLKDTVQQDQGNYAALMADVLVRHAQGEPVLYYAYSPHWLLTKLKPEEDVIWLDVPPPESSDDADLGFSITKQRIVANQTFIDENPVAKRFFEVIAIPVDDLNRESSLINDGEDSSDDIRRHAEEWVENNSGLFEGWLKEAQQAAGSD